LAAGVAAGRSFAAPKLSYKKQTLTFKTVKGLAIKASVARPDDNVARKVVVSIHGGALIMGHRDGVSGRVRDWAQNAGHVIVSIDYRLAPETRLPEIHQDVVDAFAWIRKDGPRLFHADTSKIAVVGGSAGGHLTFTTGYRVSPRPTVLLPLWGYGDLVGDWLSKPSPHPRHNQRKVSKEVALKQIAAAPISDSRERQGNGSLFYLYCRQQGIWPQNVSPGWNPHTQEEKFHPYMAVKNVGDDYPPTVMIHGDQDTDVPHEQSLLMVEQFKRYKIPHKLHTIVGGEHGLGGGDPKLISSVYEEAFAFMDQRMQG